MATVANTQTITRNLKHEYLCRLFTWAYEKSTAYRDHLCLTQGLQPISSNAAAVPPLTRRTSGLLFRDCGRSVAGNPAITVRLGGHFIDGARQV